MWNHNHLRSICSFLWEKHFYHNFLPNKSIWTDLMVIEQKTSFLYIQGCGIKTVYFIQSMQYYMDINVWMALCYNESRTAKGKDIVKLLKFINLIHVFIFCSSWMNSYRGKNRPKFHSFVTKSNIFISLLSSFEPYKYPPPTATAGLPFFWFMRVHAIKVKGISIQRGKKLINHCFFDVITWPLMITL